MLTGRFAALPESTRPSDGVITAFVATKFPQTSGPGTLRKVPLTSTSMRGTVCVARNLTLVRNGDCWRQYCAGTQLFALSRARTCAEPRTDVVLRSISGI